jgi:hypothetical protein
MGEWVRGIRLGGVLRVRAGPERSVVPAAEPEKFEKVAGEEWEEWEKVARLAAGLARFRSGFFCW